MLYKNSSKENYSRRDINYLANFFCLKDRVSYWVIRTKLGKTIFEKLFQVDIQYERYLILYIYAI